MYSDSAASAAIAYLSEHVKKLPVEKRNSYNKVNKIPLVKTFIKKLCDSFPDKITQIYVKMSGDIEIRFINEEELKKFLYSNSEITLEGKLI